MRWVDIARGISEKVNQSEAQAQAEGAIRRPGARSAWPVEAQTREFPEG